MPREPERVLLLLPLELLASEDDPEERVGGATDEPPEERVGGATEDLPEERVEAGGCTFRCCVCLDGGLTRRLLAGGRVVGLVVVGLSLVGRVVVGLVVVGRVVVPVGRTPSSRLVAPDLTPLRTLPRSDMRVVPELRIRPSDDLTPSDPLDLVIRPFAVLVIGLSELRIADREVRTFISSRDAERTDISRGVPT